MPNTVRTDLIEKKKAQLTQARRDLKRAAGPIEREVITKRIDRLLDQYHQMIT